MSLAPAFDDLAETYDASFTTGAIGRRMRAAVQRRLDVAFHPGDHILELNCGTGEDAIYLARRGVRVLATDISPRMLDLTRKKAEAAGLSDLVDIARIAIEDLARLPAAAAGQDKAEGLPDGPFDGALSNFGGLNCVEDLRAVASGLASRVRPGARLLLCVMGPVVPWEWIWYVAHGQPRKALRRLRPGGVQWRGLTIRYPSIGALRRAFARDFVQRRVCGLGMLVPPSDAEGWAARQPRLLAALDRWERRMEAVPPVPWLSDHYLIELERVGPRS